MYEFTGFATDRTSSHTRLEAFVNCMADTIKHECGDGASAVVDVQASSALGFNRLSIIDLAPVSYHPMASSGCNFGVVLGLKVESCETLRRAIRRWHSADLTRPFRYTQTLIVIAITLLVCAPC